MLSDPGGDDIINVPLRILVKPSAYPHHPHSDRTAVTMAMFWRVVDLWHQEMFSYSHVRPPFDTHDRCQLPGYEGSYNCGGRPEMNTHHGEAYSSR